MKLWTKVVLTLSLVCVLAGLGFGQTALTATTLNGAVNGPAFYNGNSSANLQGVVCLASVTGISAPSLGGSPLSIIYVGREAMGVFTVNTTSSCVKVIRGFMGTQATPHPTGDMVLVSLVYNPANGGNPVPSGLFDFDPPQGASCTTASTATTPWVNVLTGDQWLCSSVTGTWVPGFNNKLVPVAAGVTTAVASAAGAVTPSGPLFHITGTSAITGFNVPVGCNGTAVGGCQFTVIPDAIFTWTAAGNIALAGTAVVNKALTFVWDAKNSKWIPSYIA